MSATNFNGSASANFFQGASNVNISGGTLSATVNMYRDTDPLNLLNAEVSPNAILNAGGRADPVGCYPGTREEVISKIEEWMSSNYREDRRIFWLSGPAGAGKSAIVQTIAENCARRQVAMANFFFFRADASRNMSRPFVPTLLHQLLELFPDLVPLIIDIIGRNRLIFKKSLRDQFMLLIDGPIRSLRRETPNAPPIVLLVDGLDECDPHPELDNTTKSEQNTVLDVLHELLMSPGSPFIALVASRVESHIQMAFNRIGCAGSSIYLNEDYKPKNDIRLYISSELANIKRTHPLHEYLAPEWPSESIIESIVDKSSGQFIYASTVTRFIAFSSRSPSISMDMVLSIRPVEKHSPFAEIDAIYKFILSRCEQWEFASSIVALINIRAPAAVPLSPLGYSEDEAASFFADLTSIIKATAADHVISLEFYHASFNDFLYSPTRAGKFHLDLSVVATALTPGLMLGFSDLATFLLATNVLDRVNQRSDTLTHALTHLPPKPHSVNWDDLKDDLFPKVRELYHEHDPVLYRQIYRSLKSWADPESLEPDSSSLLSLDSQDGGTQDSQAHSLDQQTATGTQCGPPNSAKQKPKRSKWLRRLFH